MIHDNLNSEEKPTNHNLNNHEEQFYPVYEEQDEDELSGEDLESTPHATTDCYMAQITEVSPVASNLTLLSKVMHFKALEKMRYH